jgi:hypothetical protein
MGLIAVSFLLEPLFVSMASQFGHWSDESQVWKVIVGSWSYRFVTVAHVLFYFLRHPDMRSMENFSEAQKAGRRHRSVPWSLVVAPLVFLASGGWEWLHSILTPSSGDTLLQLKVFFVGFVLSFLVASRIFSLWLGTLVVGLILPPTQGHWLSSSYMGVIMDGLILGWWISPFKGQALPRVFDVWSSALVQKRFFVVTLLAWLGGTVFSAVGAPLPVCWVTTILGVWAYSQLTGPLSQQNETLSIDRA